ncbi:MAG TPA: 3-oxoadipate enol-lactonase [Gemmataceae bacterium]|nr:3-oxoadipate enol-lactonase [Gemmataceae bacterium]
MPFATVDDARVHYRIDGQADGPILVLSHSLGADLTVWDAQAAALTGAFRVLRYDARGHGASSVTPGPYTVERLARDALGVLDALAIPRTHFCGLSLGGMVGLWLGAHAAERLGKLVLANTAARIGTPEFWKARIDAVQRGSLAAVAPAVLDRWLTAGFREQQTEAVAAVRRALLATAADGYIAGCAAVRDADLRDAARAVAVPTLVIAGARDAVTPPADSRWVADAIPGARYCELAAVHLSNVEATEQFTAAVSDFLTQ